MQKIYHKRNELLEVEFYQDKDCKIPFDFTDAKDLYIELKDGDCTPAIALSNKLFALDLSAVIYTPLWHLGYRDNFNSKIILITLNDIQYDKTKYKCNLSKYIPEDNAVLFLSQEDLYYYFNNYNEKPLPKSIQEQFYRTMSENHKKYKYCIYNDLIDKIGYELYQEEKYYEESDATPHWEEFNSRRYLKTLLSDIGLNKLTIFLSHGTQSELQKANEVAKELKEKYGVEEVNVFVLHCFVSNIYEYNSSFADDFYKQNFQDAYDELCGMGCKPNVSKKEYKIQFEKDKLNHKQECYINKIITTNSTSILEPQDNERLQVIDCFDIFNDAL